jgi:hypothetical protein
MSLPRATSAKRQAKENGASNQVSRKLVDFLFELRPISASNGRRQMVHQLHRCAVLRLQHHK